MSTTIATLRALLTLDISQFTANARRANAEAGSMQSGMRAAGAGTIALGNMLGNVGTMGVTAMLGLGRSALTMGIQTAASAEQANIAFTKFFKGNTAAADAFMKDLQKFAAETPFEFPELRSAASRFLAIGVEAKRVIPIMRTVGDSVASIGGSAEMVDRATTALIQMSMKGKVSAEEMLQLTEAGIPAWDALAAKLGVDIPTAMDKVTKGVVKADDVFTALETNAGKSLQGVKGMMEVQSKSLLGLWSTFKDTLSAKLGDAFAPLVESAKKALPGVTAAMDTGLGVIVPALQGTVNWLSVRIPQALGVLSQKWEEIKPIVEAGAQRLGEVVSAMGRAIEGGLKWLVDNDTALNAAAITVGTLLAGAFVGLAGAAWSAAAGVIAATWPILLIAAALGGLYFGLKTAWENSEEFRTRVTALKDELLRIWNEVLVPLGTYLQSEFKKTWEDLKGVWEFLQPSAVMLKDALLKIWNEALLPMVNYIKDNQEQFKNLAVAIGVVIGVVLALLAAAVLFSTAATVIFAVFFASVVIGLTALGVTIMRVIQWLWDFFNNARDVAGGVIDFIENVIQIINDLAQNVASAIADVARWFNDMGHKADEMAKRVINKVLEIGTWFQGLPGRILEAVGQLGSLLYNTGRDLLAGLINGVTSKLGELRNAVAGVANSLPGWIKGPLGIRSPSTVTMKIGGEVTEGLRLGILKDLGGVAAAAAQVAAATSSGLFAAMRELKERVMSGARIYEDLAFEGMSENFARHNDQIADMFWSGQQGLDWGSGSGARQVLDAWLNEQLAPRASVLTGVRNGITSTTGSLRGDPTAPRTGAITVVVNGRARSEDGIAVVNAIHAHERTAGTNWRTGPAELAHASWS